MVSSLFTELQRSETFNVTLQSPTKTDGNKQMNIALIVVIFFVVLALLALVSAIVYGIIVWRRRRTSEQRQQDRDREAQEAFQKKTPVDEDGNVGNDSGRSTWDTVKNKLSFKKQDMTPLQTTNPDEIEADSTASKTVFLPAERKISTEIDEIDGDLGEGDGGGRRPVYGSTTEDLP